MLSRRQMFKMGLLTGTAFFTPKRRASALNKGKLARSFWDSPSSPSTTPFIDPLPVPPVAQRAPAFASPCTGSLGVVNPHYYQIVEEVALHRFSSQLPMTPIWRYRDAVGTPPNAIVGAGPTFKVYMAEAPLVGTVGSGSVIMRMTNNLDPNHIGFGCPCTTTHLHGGHQESRSEGFPESIPEFGENLIIAPTGHDVCQPPEDIEEFVLGCEPGAPTFFDYCYAMRDVGFSGINGSEVDVAERASTNWYHDHLFDFTAVNVYRGLAGFYLVYDEYDADDETGALFPNTNLRLPSGPYDIPLVLSDKMVGIDGGLAHLVYDSMDHDGFLGDKFAVNGVFQPYLNVERRKYRFRFLNGSNARHYLLRLFKNSNRSNPRTFAEIARGGGLYNYPLLNRTDVFLANAQRLEVVIDFSQYDPGDTVTFYNVLRQDSGRGPGGDNDDPDILDESDFIPMLQFRVQAGSPDDPSSVDYELPPPRRIEPIPQDDIDNAVRRHFELNRSNGAWQINGRFVDLERVDADPEINRGEVWTFENGGGGWWHPTHVHLEFMRVISWNGGTPPLEFRDGFAKEDTVRMGPNDEFEIYFKFRDFLGQFVFHCHNVEHEDMRMMSRFDVKSPWSGPHPMGGNASQSGSGTSAGGSGQKSRRP